MSILLSMTELPEEELREHVHDVLRRAEAGEKFVVIRDGEPIVTMTPADPPPRELTWDEFWTRLEAIPYDPSFAADIRDLVDDGVDGEDRQR